MKANAKFAIKKPHDADKHLNLIQWILYGSNFQRFIESRLGAGEKKALQNIQNLLNLTRPNYFLRILEKKLSKVRDKKSFGLYLKPVMDSLFSLDLTKPENKELVFKSFQIKDNKGKTLAIRIMGYAPKSVGDFFKLLSTLDKERLAAILKQQDYSGWTLAMHIVAGAPKSVRELFQLLNKLEANAINAILASKGKAGIGITLFGLIQTYAKGTYSELMQEIQYHNILFAMSKNKYQSAFNEMSDIKVFSYKKLLDSYKRFQALNGDYQNRFAEIILPKIKIEKSITEAELNQLIVEVLGEGSHKNDAFLSRLVEKIKHEQRSVKEVDLEEPALRDLQSLLASQILERRLNIYNKDEFNQLLKPVMDSLFSLDLTKQENKKLVTEKLMVQNSSGQNLGMKLAMYASDYAKELLEFLGRLDNGDLAAILQQKNRHGWTLAMHIVGWTPKSVRELFQLLNKLEANAINAILASKSIAGRTLFKLIQKYAEDTYSELMQEIQYHNILFAMSKDKYQSAFYEMSEIKVFSYKKLLDSYKRFQALNGDYQKHFAEIILPKIKIEKSITEAELNQLIVEVLGEGKYENDAFLSKLVKHAQESVKEEINVEDLEVGQYPEVENKKDTDVDEVVNNVVQQLHNEKHCELMEASSENSIKTEDKKGDLIDLNSGEVISISTTNSDNLIDVEPLKNEESSRLNKYLKQLSDIDFTNDSVLEKQLNRLRVLLLDPSSKTNLNVYIKMLKEFVDRFEFDVTVQNHVTNFPYESTQDLLSGIVNDVRKNKEQELSEEAVLTKLKNFPSTNKLPELKINSRSVEVQRRAMSS